MMHRQLYQLENPRRQTDLHGNYGDKCFKAAKQKLGKNLPVKLKQADIYFEQFKRLLKTFLFGCSDHGAFH